MAVISEYLRGCVFVMMTRTRVSESAILHS